MKRDIRDLFKAEENLRSLPENHRDEFLQKLKKHPKKKQGMAFWLKIAAVAVIGLAVAFSLYYKQPNEPQVSPIIAQVEAVEAEYLKDIEAEWESFIAIAEDEVLVARFKKKFDELDKDYQEISTEFQEDPNNVLVIESLVENLQTRLQLLKDIQAHIKILNQKDEQYEKSI
jgi:uncharacterized protein HemX